MFDLDPTAPTYRGAFSVDFDPNVAGDIGEERLDEPFELTWWGDRALVGVGHYPERREGVVVEVPFSTFASATPGEIASPTLLDEDGDAVWHRPARREAIHLASHPSGRVLVSAFENDLFDLPSTWTEVGALSVLDVASGRLLTRDLADLDVAGVGCAGAWRAIEIDADHVAIACDGQPGGVFVMNAASLWSTSLDEAVAGLQGCVAGVASQDRSTRYLAPAPGGVLLADSPSAPDGSAAVLWSFDTDCQLLGAAQWDGPTLWDIRGLEAHPNAEQRWALVNARGEQAGVHIVDDSGQSCRRFDTLEAMLPDDHVNLAMRWMPAGDGFVLSAGPLEALDDVGVAGGLWWVQLEFGADPCTAPILGIVDLLELAPPFDAADPATWRRAGATMQVLDFAPQQ